MKQQNWIYSDNKGQKHYIGLMHGVESGNLMIHCNSRVIVIDFQVLTDKTYSFLLNEDLCKISIYKESKDYSYDLEVEEKKEEPIPTPTSKGVLKKGVDWQKLAIIGSFIGFFSLILVIAILLNRNVTPTTDLGQTSVAKVYVDEKHPFQLVYHFVDSKNNIVKDFVNLSSSNYLDETIFPIEDGDEFFVQYNYHEPENNLLVFSKPTPGQMEMYKSRAFDVLKSNYPNLSNGVLYCQINQIFTYGGLAGIASVYYQNSPVTKDFPFNKKTYLQLMEDPILKELIVKNCN